MEILKSLENLDITKSIKINRFLIFEEGFYINAEINFINDSKLYVREYLNKNIRKYSYHWQNSDGNLIVRWDNAPHHKNLTTFPYHKHIENNVLDCKEISLKEVIEYIKNVFDND